MTLFQLAQMARIVPKFEWSCFNFPNMIKAVGICPNVSNLWKFIQFMETFLTSPKFEWSCPNLL